MSRSAVPDSTHVLNSWKEISRYLGRGARTAQRWERDLGLPVRHPRGKGRGPVVALREELDGWLAHCPKKSKLAELKNVPMLVDSSVRFPVSTHAPDIFPERSCLFGSGLETAMRAVSILCQAAAAGNIETEPNDSTR